ITVEWWKDVAWSRLPWVWAWLNEASLYVPIGGALGENLSTAGTIRGSNQHNRKQNRSSNRTDGAQRHPPLAASRIWSAGRRSRRNPREQPRFKPVRNRRRGQVPQPLFQVLFVAAQHHRLQASPACVPAPLWSAISAFRSAAQ